MSMDFSCERTSHVLPNNVSEHHAQKEKNATCPTKQLQSTATANSCSERFDIMTPIPIEESCEVVEEQNHEINQGYFNIMTPISVESANWKGHGTQGDEHGKSSEIADGTDNPRKKKKKKTPPVPVIPACSKELETTGDASAKTLEIAGDTAANDNYKQNKEKQTRWCFYEMYEKGSCPYGDGKCTFSHNVPLKGKEMMQEWVSSHIKGLNKNERLLNELTKKLSHNAKRTNSQMQHFLMNVIKEMVNKERMKTTSC